MKRFKTKFLLLFFLALFEGPSLYAQLFPMEDFIGVNLRRQDPVQYLDCAGFVREYHDWAIDEGDLFANTCFSPGNCLLSSEDYPNNTYKWNPGYQGQSYTQFDNFYDNILNNLDASNTGLMPICADMKFCLPRIAGGGFRTGHYPEFKPVRTNLSINGNPEDPDDPIGLPTTITPLSPLDQPASYEHFADWITQFSMTYGGNAASGIPYKIHADQNGTAQGQGKVSYIEIWNEQDKDWFDHLFNDVNMIKFTPQEYAAMASASYDGHDGAVRGDLPANPNNYDLGVGNVDGNLKYVFGGLSELDDDDWQYVLDVQAWCAVNRAGFPKEFPFDVLNFHHYCDNKWDGVDFSGVAGVSPESDSWNGKKFKERMIEIRNLVDATFGSGMELWLSEFGWDTNTNSPQRTPTIAANPNGINIEADRQEVQGQWLVRAYLEIASAGWDRAMQFCIRDEESIDAPLSGGLFNSSGLIKDKASGYTPKKSYYYVHTMKEVLRGTKFATDLSTDPLSTTASDPRIYQFTKGSASPTQAGEIIYTAWLPTSNNEATSNFTLDLPAATTQATIVNMLPGDKNGVREALSVNNNGGQKSVNIDLSERPIFIILGISETDQTLACPENLQGLGLSCDAVQLEWNIPAGVTYDNYRIYYYEKNDNQESNPPVFDIGDPSWKLYTNTYPGDLTKAVVSGLENLLDTYAFYIEGEDSQGNITQGCMIEIETATCSGHIPSSEITVSPSSADILFDYSDVEFCYPQQEAIAYSSFNLPSEWTISFAEGYLIDALSLFDVDGIGNLEFYYSTTSSGNNFQPLRAPYLTEFYETWISLPAEVSPQPTIRRLRFVKTASGANPGKIVLYGRKANQSYASPECCGSGNAVVIGSDANSVSLVSVEQNNGLPGNHVGITQEVVINGTLIVDVPLFGFDSDSRVYMKPGAKILVNGGQMLDINNNTIIQGCEAMWEGIDVQHAGKVVLNNSTIRDANKAVQIRRHTGGVPSDLTFWSINDCLFEMNYRGLFIHPKFNTTSDIDLASFVNRTKFDGTGTDLKPAFPGQIGWDFIPRSGIEATRLELMNVDGSPDQPTSFSNMDNGIYANTCGINATNVRFADIWSRQKVHPFLGVYTTGGFGIHAFAGHLNLVGTGKDQGSTTASFHNVHRALELYNDSYEIREVAMFNVDRGIWANLGKPFANIVENNTMNVNENGMILGLNVGPNITVKVLNNNVSNDQTKTVYGISAGGYAAFNTANQVYDIRDNTLRIRSDNSQFNGAAIALASVNKANIENNEITLNNFLTNSTSGQVYGIHNSNSTATTICSNEITGWNKTVGSGIHLLNSPLSDLNCNSVDVVKYGLTFELDCEAPNQIKGNFFGKHDIGLYLRQQGSVFASTGVQSHTGNRWTQFADGAANEMSAFFEGDPDLATRGANRFEVTDNEPEIDPNIFTPFSDWIIRDNITDNYSCPTEIPMECTTNHVFFNQDGGLYKAVALGLGNSRLTTPAYKNVVERRVYRQIQEEYGSRIPASFTGFVNSFEASPAKAYYDLDQAISALGGVAEGLSKNAMDKREAFQKHVETHASTLNGLKSQNAFQLQTWLRTSTRRTFNDEAYRLSNERFSFEDNWSQQYQSEVQQLLSQNRGLPASAEFETDEQVVNDIYLNLLAANTVDIDEKEMAALEVIAYKCPASGGEGVLKARALLLMVTGNPVILEDDCEPATKRTADPMTAENTIAHFDVAISPNPVQDQLSINISGLHPERSIQWFVNDVTGKRIATGQQEGQQFRISTGNMQNGIYFITLYDDQQNKQVKRFIVQH